MHFSKEVLTSIQNNITFQNIDEIFNILDCEHVLNNNKKLTLKDTLYWIDNNLVINISLIESKCILLMDNKKYEIIKNKNINAFRIIKTDNPKILFDTIVECLDNNEYIPEIHPNTDINPFANIGRNVSIGSGTVIDEACIIGDNSIINSNCSIGKGVKIGNNSVIHSGARIGFNIFGFKNSQSGKWLKYQQVAGVKIGNNVTIGSNTCINNGFISDTLINDNVFIDSLCLIGEGVTIGNNTIIAANSYIGTDSIIGDNCWISPNVSIKENIKIADNVFVGIGSVVLKDITKPCRVFGVPAKLINFN